jgi:ribonucleoside-diphosphate reductase alpha chain
MEAVRDGLPFGLRSAQDQRGPEATVDARKLWQKILSRLQTGEPYLIFSDTVNRQMPQHQRDLGLSVRQSNLCSEIMLHTGMDHLTGVERTAVCCLSSVNAENVPGMARRADEFIEDVMRFLDNVLEDFIDRAPPEMERAVYAAKRERSVGLGLMGFHSFLQSQARACRSNRHGQVVEHALFKHCAAARTPPS